MKTKLLLLFVAMLSLASCKKDKDENKLEGRWNLSKSYALVNVNGQKQSEETLNHQVGDYYMVFEGTKVSVYAKGKLEGTGTFTLNESTLTITEDGDNEVVTLQWNSNDEFMVKLEETETLQGASYHYKFEQTYNRHQ